ncbi:MAG: putative endoribonuclease [Caulobacteraceae bacterium]|jgi:2-iminobutanoate/2-iminopropanoate deaminase|nr:putative endoribonuclease [Caulobacteraceae bacterium]
MSQPEAKPLAAPLSKARRAGNLLFVSGQLPRNAEGQIVAGDIVVQTRQALANLQAVLTANGAKLADVVKVTAWLTEPGYIDAFNGVYREWFAEPYPTRSTVVSQLVAAADVEIEAVAYLE